MTRLLCAVLGVLAPLGATASTWAAPTPQPPGHTLAVVENGTGSGTVTSSDGAISCPPGCSHFYISTGPVTITATPAAGSTFSGWSGACSGTASTCTVSMTSERTATATFTRTSSGPLPRAKPTCTLHVPSVRVLLKASRSHPAKRRKVGKLALSFSCDQKVTATLTVRLVEYVPGAHHPAVRFALTRRYPLPAHRTHTIALTLWSRALRGLRHHNRETIMVTLTCRNANGTVTRGMAGSLVGVG